MCKTTLEEEEAHASLLQSGEYRYIKAINNNNQEEEKEEKKKEEEEKEEEEKERRRRTCSENRSCVKAEVDVLGFPSIIDHMVSVEVK